MERAKALLLTDVEYNDDGGWESHQYELLDPDSARGYLGINDNGGAPDGNAWLIWPVNPANENVQAAIAAGAELVDGWVASYHPMPWKEAIDQFASGDDWSGVGSADEAFFTNCRDAALSEAACYEYEEDDDLDTIAARVNSERWAHLAQKCVSEKIAGY